MKNPYDYYHVFEIQIGNGMRHCVIREGSTVEEAQAKLPDDCQNFGLIESYPTRQEAEKYVNGSR